ncbi:MAG TPA: G1 family glutamic endopeptidase [Acidimicrobiales bacterium]|nr:G1 family glutamic endopeptidase [Acidimicrobiales bacterium]
MRFPHFAHSDQTWSGYAVTAGGPYKKITGSWTISSLDCSKGNGSVSPWIGIDGWSNSTVEQIGVDYDCSNGKASYHTWVEMYPAGSDYFPETVHAGDTMSASVSVSGSAWVLWLSDPTEGWKKTFHRTSTDKEASAEAILEDLGSTGAPPVDDFGTESFSSLLVNGAAFASAGTAHKTSLERGTTFLSSESAVSSESFSITWLHS